MTLNHPPRLRILPAIMLGLIAGAGMLSGCQSAPQAGPDTAGHGAVSPQARAQADQLIDRAHHFLKRGLSDSALAAFGLALEHNPNLVQAHLGMGDIYRDRKNYKLSEAAYQRAHRLAPEQFDTNYDLGLVEQLLGKTQRAIKLYLQAISAEPDSPKANDALASAYLTLNRPDAALPYASRAAELKPRSQGVLVNLATTYRLLGRYAQAVTAYRTAAELGPLGDVILPGLADAHIQLGHYFRAINVLKTVLQRSDDDQASAVSAHERMGYAYFKLGRYDKALGQYRAALKINPEDTASLNGQGVCLMTRFLTTSRTLDNQRKLTQTLEAARASWRKSLSIRPDQPRIIDLLNRYRSF